ncbi:MAG: hypothetical protein IIA14_06560 [SAR324 cluster bacterium]|nr:hypothetical protein [SAR324 cluster bacterium]
MKVQVTVFMLEGDASTEGMNLAVIVTLASWASLIGVSLSPVVSTPRTPKNRSSAQSFLIMMR